MRQMDKRKFQELRRQFKAAEKEANQAQGQLDELMRQLQDEFNCSTVEEAEELLARWRKDELRLTERYNQRLKKFEDKWKDVINGEA